MLKTFNIITKKVHENVYYLSFVVQARSILFIFYLTNWLYIVNINKGIMCIVIQVRRIIIIASECKQIEGGAWLLTGGNFECA